MNKDFFVCKNCGQRVHKTSTYCVNCGQKMSQNKQYRIMICVMILLVFLGKHYVQNRVVKKIALELNNFVSQYYSQTINQDSSLDVSNLEDLLNKMQQEGNFVNGIKQQTEQFAIKG